jgi:hypothetical protein
LGITYTIARRLQVSGADLVKAWPDIGAAVSLRYFFAVSPSCSGHKSASFQSSYLLDKSSDLQK